MIPVTLTFTAIEAIRRLPGTWTIPELRRLLTVLEIDGADSFADTDVEEMALMALQDHDPEEAMRLVLTDFTDHRFSRGQVQNLLEELKEERAWEEYPDMYCQRALYVCVDLLNRAFPHAYPKPSASSVRLLLSGPGLAKAHARHPLDAATLLRTMGRCQDQRSILNRFFGDQIRGAAFPETDAVIWLLEVTPAGADQLAVHCCGSAYWFRGLDEDDEGSCEITWPG